MDGGAWWAAVHGATKSQTRLSDFTFTFHFHELEKEMAAHSSVLACRIPGTGEPGGLPSLGSHRVGHDWSDFSAAAVGDFSGSLWLRLHTPNAGVWVPSLAGELGSHIPHACVLLPQYFFLRFFFFGVDHLKFFIKFVTILLLFYGVFGHKAWGS